MNPQNKYPPEKGGFHIDQEAKDKMTAFKNKSNYNFWKECRKPEPVVCIYRAVAR